MRYFIIYHFATIVITRLNNSVICHPAIQPGTKRIEQYIRFYLSIMSGLIDRSINYYWGLVYGDELN